MHLHETPSTPVIDTAATAMAPDERNLFDRIDLHLIRVLHQVLSERSVSRAALRLGMHQPAVSAAVKRLRELSGDPLLVRNGTQMVPTEAGQRMLEPAANMLRAAETLFTEARSFDAPAASPFTLPPATTSTHCPCRIWWPTSSARRPWIGWRSTP